MQLEHAQERAWDIEREPVKSWQRALALLAFLALVAFFVWHSPIGSSRTYTCVVCRLLRIDYNYLLGLMTTSDYRPTDCSEWYAQNVDAEHEHIWVVSTCSYKFNLFGSGLSVACRAYVSAIWGLSPEDELEIYKQFANPEDAQELFKSLGSEEKTELHHNHDIVQKLEQWLEAGFPGSWEVWTQSDSNEK
jgi:hypothetical protein